MNPLIKIYLYFWRSHKRVGPKREIRLTRTYEYFGNGVYDLIWCLRDRRPGTSRKQHHRPTVLMERTMGKDAKATIKRIETQELPTAIQEFLERIHGEGK